MIRSYGDDEIVESPLPGDDVNPTIFHFWPMTGRAKSKWRAMTAHASKRILDAMVDETAERAIKITDRQADEEVAFISARVQKITNAIMRKEHHELIEGDKVKLYVEGMLATQRDDLIRLMQDDIKLQELSFRDNPIPATGSGKAKD